MALQFLNFRSPLLFVGALALAGCTGNFGYRASNYMGSGWGGLNSPSTQAPINPVAPQVSGASAVTGTLQAGGTCASGVYGIQLLAQYGEITSGQVLNQTTLPAGGTFEFQANPGTYLIVAQSPLSYGCGAQQTVTLVPGQVAQVNLVLGAGVNTGGSYYSNPYSCPWGTYGCMAG